MTAVHPNVETLRAVYRDLTCIGDHLDEHAVLHPATRAVDPDAGEVRGAAAVQRWEVDLVDSTDATLVMDVQHITANDHFGAVLGTLRARFGDQEFTEAFCGLWRFRDGRIVEHWENIYDPRRLAAIASADRRSG
ncbi:nuclear transport factor 2 family protein [Kutzneria buriramensis]|uniref:SnoaL-like protein n=1 Tax=Kutzneria buriramensis TaxID=1045776 RepID=A0A3E0HL77_9PSEU|nr:nuclear transport factor 2 family protein [Kutzneria buriramensis]REH47100.1 SnoaL-like protein [Kutzneria buriramensis]